MTRSKRKPTPPPDEPQTAATRSQVAPGIEDESTDLKLGTLASLFPDIEQTALLDMLIGFEGSVERVCDVLSSSSSSASLSPKRKTGNGVGHQTSLAASFKQVPEGESMYMPQKKAKTRKGQTLHLYSPADIEAHTPCSIIHNFLPAQVADELLKELLEEAPSFERQTFKMFDNVVQSPHSACFYVENLQERERQQTEYLYNGSFLTDIRQITPQMRNVSGPVQKAVNDEVARRIQRHYPGGRKLKYQSPKDWVPNAAFVNCYKGGSESVGYHCDQLTYLGPRAIIGSLSLGVAREFRVRKIVARDESAVEGKPVTRPDNERADAEGQIAIHLPHNSLLVMHAEVSNNIDSTLTTSTSSDLINLSLLDKGLASMVLTSAFSFVRCKRSGSTAFIQRL
ncbi:hypothetical protein XANCAGTX0491_004255 [Xanthoria calcicola]